MNIDAVLMWAFVLVLACGLGLCLVIWGQVRRYEMLQGAYDELMEQGRRDRRAGYNAEMDLVLKVRYWRQRCKAAEAARDARAEGESAVIPAFPPTLGPRPLTLAKRTPDTRHPTLSEAEIFYEGVK